MTEEQRAIQRQPSTYKDGGLRLGLRDAERERGEREMQIDRQRDRQRQTV